MTVQWTVRAANDRSRDRADRVESLSACQLNVLNLLTFQQVCAILVEISTYGGNLMQERFEIFTVLINRISRNIRKIKNQEMAEYNLRSAQVSCLYYLYMHKGATATDLCERCEEDKATISRALDYLENNGFIICKSKNAKRYKSPLILTDKGNQVGEKIADKIRCVLDAIGGGLTEEERVAFYRSLSIVSDSLETVSKNKE